jgi:winged helix-turn helix protein
MGTRVTRAAQHVSAQEIAQRMQSEVSPWRRRYWHIIWLALTRPRSAQEIAQEAGVSPMTVHRALRRYREGGVEAIAQARKGGRRHATLPLAEETSFLAPFAQRAQRGERVGVEEIQQALHARLATQSIGSPWSACCGATAGTGARRPGRRDPRHRPGPSQASRRPQDRWLTGNARPGRPGRPMRRRATRRT